MTNPTMVAAVDQALFPFLRVAGSYPYLCISQLIPNYFFNHQNRGQTSGTALALHS